MTEPVFRETSAQPRTESVPLSHLSLELGHLHMEDLQEGPERLRAHFVAVRPWLDAARAGVAALTGGRTLRLSTCFLIDDYFTRFSTPAELLPQVLAAAEEAGLAIDYVARESGCAVAEDARLAKDVQLAESVMRRLVESPPPGSNGFRPPVSQTGWLTNGERTPALRTSAAMTATVWKPPSETGAVRHSIHMDVELWDEHDERRTWSCPFLAAVWQLARLGLLRDDGRPVPHPHLWNSDGFPHEWDALPPLLQLTPSAAPFTAYFTCTVLPTRFLPVEHAVRVILDQVHADSGALQQVAQRSGREGIDIPAQIADRAFYIFPPGL
ncbi:SCO2522 family protein [Streptomyces prunicolor]|uniref:SCO2522 family protein n=1 Tax=Streptomyces prunicolor TaxID=67348 RepID=UPI0038630316|nr:SCO2522 family protein [Streptomyces prunicolor]